ncbi:MAG: ABC transporter permease [Candidatus Bipolaricaulaceae bacterium]
MTMGFGRYLGLYLGFLGQVLKSRAADPADFWVEVLSIFLYQGLGLAFISVIFAHVPELAGWSLAEILLIFGVFQMVTSLFYLFFPWTLWFSRHYLLRRALDVILVRPFPPLLQVMAEGTGQGLSELTGVVLGMGIVVYAFRVLDRQLSVAGVGLLLLGVACGTLILGGLFTLLAMLGFWAKASSSAATPLMEILEFGQYPLTIYSPWLRWVFTFLLPLGFVAFVPAGVALGQASGTWLIASVLWAAGLWALALFLWRRGLRRYESAGS